MPLPITKPPLLYECFENYFIHTFPGVNHPPLLPFSIHPRNGGTIENWLICPWGELVEPSLNTDYAWQGKYSLKMAYRLPAKDSETNISRVYENPNLDWTGYNAVRFWLKPDNTGREFLFMTLPQYHTPRFPDGTPQKEFYFCSIRLNGCMPILVTMPFRCFKGLGSLAGGPVNETAFWIGKGKAGSGVIFIDHIEAVCVPDDASVTILPVGEQPALTRQSPVRINAGSSRALTDTQGLTWEADSTWYVGGDTVDFGDAAVAATDSPALYRFQRIDLEGYALPLPAGRYRPRLHFAEMDIRCNAPGKRVFRVKAGDADMGTVDAFAETGCMAWALVKESVVDVGGDGLRVEFEAVEGVPAVAGLEVVAV